MTVKYIAGTALVLALLGGGSLAIAAEQNQPPMRGMPGMMAHDQGMMGAMGCPMMSGGMMGGMMGRGVHMPMLPPGNEKLQLQMQAEIMQKVGEIMAKYANQLPPQR
ncbi:MAG: hypothetical protein HY661_10340 [Betaproteobacteria bacterium]|nr:hypothetical protein [Betaproteobacteria bacterium]